MLKHIKPDPSKVPAFFEPTIDFTFDSVAFSPPYQHYDGFLSNEDCEKLIILFENAPVRESVSVQGLKDIPSGKGSERTTMWSEELAAMLTDKLLAKGMNPFLITNEFSPTEGWQNLDKDENTWKLVGFSPLLRFMKYDNGGEHYPHYDAGFIYPDGEHRTLQSVVIYLTTNRTGSTRFIKDGQAGLIQSERNNDDWSRNAEQNEVYFEVLPNKGKVLIFQHRLCHDVGKFQPENDDEVRMIIRGDLIYKKI